MIETYENVNISAKYQGFCMKSPEQGSFFQAGQNESKEWYAMIKTYKNVNISAGYQQFCMKLQNRTRFSELVKMSSRSDMLQLKLTKM